MDNMDRILGYIVSRPGITNDEILEKLHADGETPSEGYVQYAVDEAQSTGIVCGKIEDNIVRYYPTDGFLELLKRDS